MTAITRYVTGTAALTAALLIAAPATARADPTITLTIDTTEILEHRYSTNCNYLLTAATNPGQNWEIAFADTAAHSFNSYPYVDANASGVADILWRPLAPGTHQLSAALIFGLLGSVVADTVTVDVTDTPCTDIINLPQFHVPQLPPFQQIPRPGPLAPGPR